MKLKAPAKINLFLKILRRRADGYHDLFMLMEKLNLCDTITLEKTKGSVELARSLQGVPLEKNLCFKAASLLKKAAKTEKGARITLEKHIPMGGGLGGGSSDAAAVLKGLNELWGLDWPLNRLAEIGVKIGADVPFFLYEGPAFVEGIGDKITPLKRLPNLPIILINPGIHLSTPWAYQAWDEGNTSVVRKGGGNQLTQKNQSVRSGCDFGNVIAGLANDFEPVVFSKYPEMAEAKKALTKAGAAGALMSGSGSTLFGVFETEEVRNRAFEKLKGRPEWKYFTAENRK